MSFDNSTSTPPPAPGPLVPPPAPAPAPMPPYPAAAHPGVTPGPIEGEKSFLATWLLALLVGVFGVDRFYLGKIGTGILKLVTFGGLGVWVLIDVILVLTGATRDASGKALSGYRQHRKVAWIVTGALVLLGFISSLVGGGTSVSDARIDRPAAVAPSSPAAAAVKPDAAVSETPEASAEEPATEAAEEKPAPPQVPAEHKTALKKAQTYSDMMHMSKAGLYDQLTSEYGEKFSAEAAQYAVDNVNADWNANALEKAKNYQEMMSMSPAAIHDQLTSSYGEKFTVEEADYAIAHLND